jgi:hypothetical protein
MSISEFRRANYQQVLDDIAQEYDSKPQKKPHSKTVKALAGKATSIRKPGVSFALPEESDFDRVT